MNPRIAELTSYIDRVRERTMRVALCVPADRLEWTYKPGKFTLGDLMRHLGAIERWMFAENVQRRPSRYPGHGRELADGLEAVLVYMTSMHEESMAVFRSLNDADLDAKCMTPGGSELAIGKWLRSMLEHEAHHRGQIYMYLGMLDIPTPPIYGLTEEQVKARSTQS